MTSVAILFRGIFAPFGAILTKLANLSKWRKIVHLAGFCGKMGVMGALS